MNDFEFMIEQSLKEEIRRTVNSLGKTDCTLGHVAGRANELVNHLRDTWELMMDIRKESSND